MHPSHRSRKAPAVVGVLLILIGLALGGGGAWLIALGGSLFYLIAGLGVVLTGILLLARRRAALWVYAIVLLGTVIWSVNDVRFDWWPLAARLDILFPLGALLLTPWITRGLGNGDAAAVKGQLLPLWIAVIASVVVLGIGLGSECHDVAGTLAAPVAGQPAGVVSPSDDVQPDEDWRDYGRTQFGQRYSPLTQVTPANVKHLKVAWTFRTGDLPTANGC
ncbi:MAG: hypothetical protein WDW38_010437 [Sanguina aurantia]